MFILSITNLSVIDSTIPPPSDAKQVCQKDEFNLKEEVVYLILIAFFNKTNLSSTESGVVYSLHETEAKRVRMSKMNLKH